MSKTISFVATDELAEYLEEEAERRMTTVSSTAQMILAEAVSGRVERQRREEQGEGTLEEGMGPAIEKMEMSGEEAPEGDEFDRHPEAWYEPRGQYNYAVYVPEDAEVYDAGETRYYDTGRGAAKAIKRWYE